MTSSNSAFHDRHYPDEYVDSAISFEPETSEPRDLPSANDILRYIIPLRRFRKDNDAKDEAQVFTSDLNLSDYHFPDEYCDAALFSYDAQDSRGAALPSQDIVGSLLSLAWLRHSHETTESPQEMDSSSLSDFDSSNCDLPDGYIDSTLTYTSPARDNDATSSAGNVLLDSIASFIRGSESDGEGNDETVGEARESPSNVSMDSCHLPDDYVDAVISYDGDSSQRDEVAPVDNDTSYSISLDRLNDKIHTVLSFDPSKSDVSGSVKVPMIKTPHKRRNHVVWEKNKSLHSVDSLDSQVPKANDSRAGSLLRKRTPSKTKVGV